MVKDIVGYEGFYTINDSGIDNETVFSVRRGKYLHPIIINSDGYKRVVLKVNGTAKNFQFHRLIAEAFIPNPDNKPYVDHIIPIRDGGTNDISNLRWVTMYENNHNPSSEKNRSEGLKNNILSKQVYQYTKEGEFVKVWPSVGECSRNGYNKGHVAACCRGEQDTHKGFKWSYIKL